MESNGRNGRRQPEFLVKRPRQPGLHPRRLHSQISVEPGPPVFHKWCAQYLNNTHNHFVPLSRRVKTYTINFCSQDQRSRSKVKVKSQGQSPNVITVRVSPFHIFLPGRPTSILISSLSSVFARTNRQTDSQTHVHTQTGAAETVPASPCSSMSGTLTISNVTMPP